MTSRSYGYFSDVMVQNDFSHSTAKLCQNQNLFSKNTKKFYGLNYSMLIPKEYLVQQNPSAYHTLIGYKIEARNQAKEHSNL